MTCNKLKPLTAGVGAAAVLIMAGVSVAQSNVVSAEPAPPGPVPTSEITTGETVVDDDAPSSPETPIATPEVKATESIGGPD